MYVKAGESVVRRTAKAVKGRMVQRADQQAVGACSFLSK